MQVYMQFDIVDLSRTSSLSRDDNGEVKEGEGEGSP